MINKIKLIFTAMITTVIAVLSLLYSREKTKRKTAEQERDTQIAINQSQNEVMEVQSKLNENALKQPTKPLEKAKKIILPVLFLFIVSCTKVQYVPVTSSPELYTFETGIELILDENSGNYCITEDEALKLQQVLNAYKKQIEIYNE